MRFIFVILLMLTSAMLVTPSMGQAHASHEMTMVDGDDCPDDGHDMGVGAEHAMTCAIGHCGFLSFVVPMDVTSPKEPITIAHPAEVQPRWQSLRPQSDLPPPRA